MKIAKIKDKELRTLLKKYDSEHSEIDFNDRVSSEKYLEAIINMYKSGYINGYRDSFENKNPKYMLAAEGGVLVNI